MSTLYGAGGLTGTHVPLPTGPQPIRPVQRRNTSPFTDLRRPAELSPAETRRAQQDAARVLANADKRKRGAAGDAYNEKRKVARRDAREPQGPPEWVERAIELYQSGLSFAKVADEVGAHEVTVNKWVKRAGIQPRNSRPRPVVDPQRIIDLASTHTAAQIAQRVGLSANTVHKHLQRAGVKAVATKRSGPEPMPLDMAKVKLLYAAGRTPREIASEVGCSHQTIRARLRAAGVTLRQEAGRKVGTEQHCHRGHAWTDENTGRNKRGHRFCKACKRITQAAWAAKNGSAA